MEQDVVGARSGFMVSDLWSDSRIFRILRFVSSFRVWTRRAIQNTNVMLPDAEITVLGTIRTFRFLNISCSYANRNFVGFSDFGIHRFASRFRCVDQGVIHKTHLMLLDAGITILGLTLDSIFEHLWPTYWSHFLSYFRISK